MYDAFLASELKTNLLPVVKICSWGYTVTFKEQSAVLNDLKDNVILIADCKDYHII